METDRREQPQRSRLIGDPCPGRSAAQHDRAALLDWHPRRSRGHAHVTKCCLAPDRRRAASASPRPENAPTSHCRGPAAGIAGVAGPSRHERSGRRVVHRFLRQFRKGLFARRTRRIFRRAVRGLFGRLADRVRLIGRRVGSRHCGALGFAGGQSAGPGRAFHANVVSTRGNQSGAPAFPGKWEASHGRICVPLAPT
jgi:hypothetical protein